MLFCSARLLASFKVPPVAIVVSPVKVLAPLSTVVPAPRCCKLPVPEMVLNTVTSAGVLSRRSNCNTLLLMIPATTSPVAAPLPSFTAPWVIVRFPRNPLTPANVNVPSPVLVNAPSPLIVLAKVTLLPLVLMVAVPAPSVTVFAVISLVLPVA